MAATGARTIEQLEREIERLRQRLAGDERAAGPAGFLGGFALGALAGGLLALIFAPQAGDQTRDQLRGAGDAILLRGHADESVSPQQAAEAPAHASTAVMPLSAPAAPAGSAAPAAPNDAAEDAGTPQAEDTSSASQVMASPAPPAPTGAEQPAAPLPPSLPGEGGHCPYSHPIKGNKSSSGELIYHLPGTRFYDRTTPEVCFATEDDAQAAGFRAATG